MTPGWSPLNSAQKNTRRKALRNYKKTLQANPADVMTHASPTQLVQSAVKSAKLKVQSAFGCPPPTANDSPSNSGSSCSSGSSHHDNSDDDNVARLPTTVQDLRSDAGFSPPYLRSTKRQHEDQQRQARSQEFMKTAQRDSDFPKGEKED